MENDSTLTKMPMRQVEAMIPEGSPVAWFPTRMADFFKKLGIDKASTRMTGETGEKELPGFRRISWGVDLPKVDFVIFAQAIAALENDEPLLAITAMQVEASRTWAEWERPLTLCFPVVEQAVT